MKVSISSIIVRDRVRKDPGDISSLMNSMREHGQLNPIALTRDNELIAGQRRLLAAQRLSWQYIEAHIVERDSAVEKLQLELEENVHRKDFSPEELLDGYRKLEKLKQPSLRRRMGDAIRRFFRKLFGRKPSENREPPASPASDRPREPVPNPESRYTPANPEESEDTPYGV